MADKTTFFCTSQAFAHVRTELGNSNLHAPFGGVHVILFGDLHQFPPVGNKSGALYCHSGKDSVNAKIGQSLFQQFDTVVMLTEQMQVQDPPWTELLQHLHTGECTKNNLEEIEKLVVNSSSCPKTDYIKPPWNNTILITPRHSVCQTWNEAAIKKHCMIHGQHWYIVMAEDTLCNGTDELPLKVRLGIAKLNENKTG